MGKIFYIMGKSSTGKDTLYKNILEKAEGLGNIVPLIIYTTRGMRVGETQGVQYHFVTENNWQELQRENKIIESRTYQRVNDEVKYFTVDDENINLNKLNYLGIGTLESFEQMQEYYGKEIMVPIYIEVDDEQRLLRAIARESQQNKENQCFREVCRRYIADDEDFREDKLLELAIQTRFQNLDLDICCNEILKYIKEQLISE